MPSSLGKYENIYSKENSFKKCLDYNNVVGIESSYYQKLLDTNSCGDPSETDCEDFWEGIEPMVPIMLFFCILIIITIFFIA